MENVTNAPTNKEEPVAAPNHTERIKAQVLAKIGKLPRLGRVEVSRHHGGKYRINIWEQPEPDRNLVVTIAARIRSSYYLTVSDTGEIIDSNPPLTKLCSPVATCPSSSRLALTSGGCSPVLLSEGGQAADASLPKSFSRSDLAK
jgi:hypothetical protein